MTYARAAGQCTAVSTGMLRSVLAAVSLAMNRFPMARGRQGSRYGVDHFVAAVDVD